MNLFDGHFRTRPQGRGSAIVRSLTRNCDNKSDNFRWGVVNLLNSPCVSYLIENTNILGQKTLPANKILLLY